MVGVSWQRALIHLRLQIHDADKWQTAKNLGLGFPAIYLQLPSYRLQAYLITKEPQKLSIIVMLLTDWLIIVMYIQAYYGYN